MSLPLKLRRRLSHHNFTPPPGLTSAGLTGARLLEGGAEEWRLPAGIEKPTRRARPTHGESVPSRIQ